MDYITNYTVIFIPYLVLTASILILVIKLKTAYSSTVLNKQIEGPLFKAAEMNKTTVMILSFRTSRSEQTVQTQIRLLLEEQSDQGLHYLLFHSHLFDEIPKCLASLFEFYVDYTIICNHYKKYFGVRKFRNFTVLPVISDSVVFSFNFR